ncbi:hypothetical protein K402DRAFT_424808 [Aulographum hederae CBS 113979]|uniref:Uncharacterized protein n=1 Tax=Aulographum hederae CBS 113979 TaxID=1176131 RepID=A0A6G1GN98_9PEZI|nr:hypothetical protein K402DRAFT_424808 [Aulographum hederae CBS 113979]
MPLARFVDRRFRLNQNFFHYVGYFFLVYAILIPASISMRIFDMDGFENITGRTLEHYSCLVTKAGNKCGVTDVCYPWQQPIEPLYRETAAACMFVGFRIAEEDFNDLLDEFVACQRIWFKREDCAPYNRIWVSLTRPMSDWERLVKCELARRVQDIIRSITPYAVHFPDDREFRRAEKPCPGDFRPSYTDYFDMFYHGLVLDVCNEWPTGEKKTG